MSRPLGIHAALGFFTVIPVPAFGDVDRETGRRAIAWFGIVGLLLGFAAAAVSLGAGAAGASPLLRAVLALTTMALLTGGLHLDGVADTFDALGSRQPPEKALAIMKKSDVGPMGVAAMALTLAIQAAALAQLGATPWLAEAALLVGCTVGRVALLTATRPGVAMAPVSSFGALFGGVTRTSTAIGGHVAMVAGAAALGWCCGSWPGAATWGAVVAMVLGGGVVWRRWLVRRLGGLNGDMFGSVIDLSATAAWLGLALFQ